MKIYCVCICGEHSDDEATIEFNFRDSTIYFVCPKCQKKYELKLKPPPEKFPRIARIK